MHIRIVDDDDISRLLYSKVFQKDECYIFEKGTEFCNEYIACDVVIINLNMPIMNGYDVLNFLYINNYNPIIYVISTKECLNHKLLYEKKLIYNYIRKPIPDISSLRDKVLSSVKNIKT